MSTTTDRAAEMEAAGNKLTGRVAFVTGGTRGIGRAICLSLASEGAIVAAGYAGNKEKAESFKKEIEDAGTSGSIHQGNVSSAEDCRRSVEEVIEQHGRLDILVNNAGITADRPVLKMSEEDWNKVIQVNLSGAFFMSKPALEHMLERGTGRIVNISSVVGQQGNIGQANYAASKAGMFGLTMTMAREAAWALAKAGKLDDDSLNVTVNAVAPGYTQTEMMEAVPEKVMEKIKKQIPLGRTGRPEEIARVVHFLCSDKSSYITGQAWAVNGGMEM